MNSYFSREAIMPHLTGPARQRGSGFGSLVLGVGRIALPFAKKLVLPAVQSIGKELFVQSSPEIMKVFYKEQIFQTISKSCTGKDSQKANRRRRP